MALNKTKTAAKQTASKPQTPVAPPLKPNQQVQAAVKAEVKQATDTALFAADAGAGFDEGVDAGAYAMPFLALLQALSPVVQPGKAEFIEDARPGMLMNTVTKEMWDGDDSGLEVSVVRRTHTLCTWNLRENGGGFISEIEADVDAMLAYQALPLDEKKRRITADKKQMTEHRNFYCQICRDGRANEPLLISMTNSQLKVAREWNSNIALKSARVGEKSQPVALSEIWTIGTTLRTKGENSWFMFTVTHKQRHTDAVVYDQIREAVPVAKGYKALARPRTDDVDTAGEPGGSSGEM